MRPSNTCLIILQPQFRWKRSKKPVYSQIANSRSINVSAASPSTMTERRQVPENSERGCCSLITRAELVLLILLGITIILFLAALVVIAWFFMSAQNVCEATSCIRSSSQLLDIIDFTANPCDDFRKYLCGNYVPSHQHCEDENKLKKKSVISVLTENSDSDSLVMVKKFYQTCTDTSAVEANDNNTLLAITEKIGGWPLLLGQEWNEKNFQSWINFMTQIRGRGFKYDWFISFDYYVDSDGKNLLMITPPDSVKISSNLYHEAMFNIGSQLGSSNKLTWDDMQKVVEFEHDLAEISQSARQKFEENETKKVKIINVQTLDEIWPQVNLMDILTTLARGYAFFTPNTTVVIADETYIFDLNILLRNTPENVKANYMIWKVIESYLPFCSENLRQIYSKYADLPGREEHCLAETTRRFYGGLETYISTKEKDEEIKESVETMSSYIKNYIGGGAENINVQITGFQVDKSDLLETNSIIKMINEVNMRTENAFFNCLHKRSTVCSKGGFYRKPEDLEIYFDINLNTVYVPFVLLHSDSYRWNQPNYINYGRLGRTLGNVFIEAMQQKNLPIDNEVSGVDLAFQSYKQWIRNTGNEKKLPALNYSSTQLFWIHSSSTFCSSEKDSDKFEEVNNSTYFREEFNCEKCKFCAL